MANGQLQNPRAQGPQDINPVPGDAEEQEFQAFLSDALGGAPPSIQAAPEPEPQLGPPQDEEAEFGQFLQQAGVGVGQTPAWIVTGKLLKAQGEEDSDQ